MHTPTSRDCRSLLPDTCPPPTHTQCLMMVTNVHSSVPHYVYKEHVTSTRARASTISRLLTPRTLVPLSRSLVVRDEDLAPGHLRRSLASRRSLPTHQSSPLARWGCVVCVCVCVCVWVCGILAREVILAVTFVLHLRFNYTHCHFRLCSWRMTDVGLAGCRRW